MIAVLQHQFLDALAEPPQMLVGERALGEVAVDTVVNRMSDEDKTKIQAMTSDQSYEYHHTVGRYLRNNWSLWEPDSAIKRDAVASYGIAHADDISGLILSWVWAKVQGIDFDPKKCCEHYHEHWRSCGTDALTAGGWNR